MKCGQHGLQVVVHLVMQFCHHLNKDVKVSYASFERSERWKDTFSWTFGLESSWGLFREGDALSSGWLGSEGINDCSGCTVICDGNGTAAITFRASLRVIILVDFAGDSPTNMVTPEGGVENSSRVPLVMGRLVGFGDVSGCRISITELAGKLGENSWAGGEGLSSVRAAGGVGISTERAAGVGSAASGAEDDDGDSAIPSLAVKEEPFNNVGSCWMERNCFDSRAKLSVGPLGRNTDWMDTMATTPITSQITSAQKIWTNQETFPFK